MFVQGALPWQYFDADYQEYVGHSLLSNIKQLMHQVTGNRAISCKDSGNIDWREIQLNAKISQIEQHFNKGNIMEGIREGDEAISFSKEALSYFRQYQRTRFLIYLSIMWLGWIIVLFLKIAGIKRRTLKIPLLRFTNFGFASLLIITLVGHLGEKLIQKKSKSN